jgi:protein phosphatase
MKTMTPEEIAQFPHKNVIVRALGMKETVRVDTMIDLPEPGDVYILCTDGLAGPASDEDIRAVALANPDLQKCAQALIDKANDRGGPDNITAVVCRWMGTA